MNSEADSPLSALPALFFLGVFKTKSPQPANRSSTTLCSVVVMAFLMAAIIFSSQKPTMRPSRFTTVCIIITKRSVSLVKRIAYKGTNIFRHS